MFKSTSEGGKKAIYHKMDFAAIASNGTTLFFKISSDSI